MPKVSELRARYDQNEVTRARSISVIQRPVSSWKNVDDDLSPSSPPTGSPQDLPPLNQKGPTLQERIRNFMFAANSPRGTKFDLPAVEEAHGITISTMQAQHRKDVNTLRSSVDEKDAELEKLREEILKHDEEKLRLSAMMQNVQTELEASKQFTHEILTDRDRLQKMVDRMLLQMEDMDKQHKKKADKQKKQIRALEKELEQEKNTVSELSKNNQPKAMNLDFDCSDVTATANNLHNMLLSFNNNSKELMEALENLAL
ncbi:lamb4 [Acrasis kona]|uniref:Lamb4 n=1 Tax=Acrasis kona TaxID=1008807 RepID=A0AAW2ZFN9_9EUKA